MNANPDALGGFAGPLGSASMTPERERENFERQEREDSIELLFCPWCGDMVGNCDCLYEQAYPNDKEAQEYAKQCDEYNRTGRGPCA